MQLFAEGSADFHMPQAIKHPLETRRQHQSSAVHMTTSHTKLREQRARPGSSPCPSCTAELSNEFLTWERVPLPPARQGQPWPRRGSFSHALHPHPPAARRICCSRAAECRSLTGSAVPGLRIPLMPFPRCWQTSPQEERGSVKPEMTCWGRVGFFHSRIMCWDLYKRGFFAGWPDPWRVTFTVFCSWTAA